jgi:xanthine dehydrogenase small subunit
MLADYLRMARGLTGTKIVCPEGDCGACSVLKKAPGEKTYTSFNSCIMPVALLDGSRVITVDALEEEEGLSPAQQAMVEKHGSQCGFCTPGFVVALTGLVEKRLARKDTEAIREKEAKNALTGNLCRCTGYQPILDAACAIPLAKCQPLSRRFDTPGQERELKRVRSQPVAIEAEELRFYAPRSLRDAADILNRRSARIAGAGSDLGVFHNKRKLRLDSWVSLHLVPKLDEVRVARSKVSVGARASLTTLRQALEKTEPEFAHFLDLFASPQIKNVATLAGNVANASPIGDTPPFLLAMDAEVLVQSARAKRKVPIHKFFVDYRKTALKKGELIAAIEWKPRGAGDFLRLYKVSQRKDLDISAVSAVFRVSWDAKGRVKDARVALGGVAATPLRIFKVEAVLRGREWN